MKDMPSLQEPRNPEIYSLESPGCCDFPYRVMCNCLSFLVNRNISQRWASWRRAILRLIRRIQSYHGPFSGLEIHRLGTTGRLISYTPTGVQVQRLVSDWDMGTHNSKILSEKCKPIVGHGLPPNPAGKRAKSKNRDAKAEAQLPKKICANGASNVACLFTQQGRKGLNQDAMMVWEDFISQKDTVFCGVFDGHGPYGHLVAQSVRDLLPPKLASHWEVANSAGAGKDVNKDSKQDEVKLFALWKESFLNAYVLMDKELLGRPSIDCFCSGTTAVTLVKQGKDVIIGNVGDSRAILGTKADDGSLIAIQLTVDLKPNLPEEAERIRQCKGRVFALDDEPEVHRVWLPNDNSPGLAMARAFGDFCLKNFGVIAIPEVTHCRLTDNDQFIVLATDGIWDVLSNEEVVNIVSSVSARPLAARAVVNTAVHAWRSKYPTSKVDDCAVVCLFTEDILAVPSGSLFKGRSKPAATSVKPHKLSAVSKSTRAGESPASGPGGKKVQLPAPPSTKGYGSASQSNSLLEQTQGSSVPLTIHNRRQARTVVSSNLKRESGTQILTKVDTSQKSSLESDGNEMDANINKLAFEGLPDEWTALEGVTRVNSLVTLPRFSAGELKR